MVHDNSKLEKLMETDPENMTLENQNLLFEELKKSQLYLPIEITSDVGDLVDVKVGDTIDMKEPLRFKPIKLYNDNNEVTVPLFTSSEHMEKANFVCSTIAIYVTDLAKNLMGVRGEYDQIMINPFSKDSIGMTLDNFLGIFFEYEGMVDNEFIKTLKIIEKLFEEKSETLEHNTIFYLREEELYMMNQSVDGVFTSEIPLNVSTDENFNAEYPYLNLLLVPEGTKVLYVGDIVDPETNHDMILSKGIKFKFIRYEDEYTLVWECISE